MVKKNGYEQVAIVSRHLLTNLSLKGVSTPARHLLTCLLLYADKEGKIPPKYSPSVSTLVKLVGMGYRHVINLIKELEAVGFLARFKRPGRRTVYRVNLPTSEPQCSSTSEPQCTSLTSEPECTSEPQFTKLVNPSAQTSELECTRSTLYTQHLKEEEVNKAPDREVDIIQPTIKTSPADQFEPEIKHWKSSAWIFERAFALATRRELPKALPRGADLDRLVDAIARGYDPIELRFAILAGVDRARLKSRLPRRSDCLPPLRVSGGNGTTTRDYSRVDEDWLGDLIAEGKRIEERKNEEVKEEIRLRVMATNRSASTKLNLKEAMKASLIEARARAEKPPAPEPEKTRDATHLRALFEGQPKRGNDDDDTLKM